jgi:hypothetical protein
MCRHCAVPCDGLQVLAAFEEAWTSAAAAALAEEGELDELRAEAVEMDAKDAMRLLMGGCDRKLLSHLDSFCSQCLEGCLCSPLHPCIPATLDARMFEDYKKPVFFFGFLWHP